jgi:hypothetical protein
VLRPGKPDHDLQVIPRRLVEKAARRRGVDADGVDAELPHQREVLCNARRRWELIAHRVRRESPVGHAFDEEALRSGAQELPIGGDGRGRGGGRLLAAQLSDVLEGDTHVLKHHHRS